MADKDIKVIPTEGAEETIEILAKSITQISEGVERLLAGPLKYEAIILLLQASIPGNITRATIKSVIDALGDLKKTYLKPQVKK